MRYIGGVVTATYNPVYIPFTGVWTMTMQIQNKRMGLWT